MFERGVHQQEKGSRYKLCKRRQNERKIMEIIALKVLFLASHRSFTIHGEITVCKHVCVSTSTYTTSSNGMTVLNDTLSNTNRLIPFPQIVCLDTGDIPEAKKKSMSASATS